MRCVRTSTECSNQCKELAVILLSFFFFFIIIIIITVQRTQPGPPNIDQPITGHINNKGVLLW